MPHKLTCLMGVLSYTIDDMHSLTYILKCELSSQFFNKTQDKQFHANVQKKNHEIHTTLR